MPCSFRSIHVLFVGLFLSFIAQSASAQAVDSVSATGPDMGSTLEDRVEIWWSSQPIAVTSSFVIKRSVRPPATPDTVDIGVVASTEFLFEDFSAIPEVEYDYCVVVRDGSGTESGATCDIGVRRIARPTGFTASDGFYEEWVALTWSDRSQIEDGYNIYRDAGNALRFDGDDDYVVAPGTFVLPASFTVEFWARRAATGGNQFIVNLENSPQGDPTSDDLEIGFNNINRFIVGFGSDQLQTAASYSDTDWHHWAVTYDSGSRRRTIYRDGAEVAFDTYGGPFSSSGILELGRQRTIGSNANKGFFDGDLDELRIWDRELGPAEIPPLQGTLLQGSEADLIGLWPMDVASGAIVPDVIGTATGQIDDANNDGNNWIPTGIPDYRRTIAANLTAYNDRSSVPSFQSYAYRLAAFEDANGDGVFEGGTDYESEQRSDDGWRASLSPPTDVVATDGQFLDRVRINWIDRSSSETSFRIYRDGGFIGSVPSDSTQYEDFTAVPTTYYTYCVAASNGVESIQICDPGHAGALPPPDSVQATNRVFDDRVIVSWLDTTDTEDGFEIFRDGGLIGTTGENAEEFTDGTAVPEEEYTYCVRAFSVADPGNPSYSDQLCTLTPGARAAVLKPENVVASDNEFEDRVEIGWTNPSATAMLFKVYRDDILIEVLDFTMTRTSDIGIPSDTPLDYCVSSETVVAPNGAASLQGQVAQILTNIRYEDAIRVDNGGERTSADAALASVYASLGLDAAGKNGAVGIDGIVESDTTCNTGSRLLNAPTEVDATDDEFESHTQVTWTDNSQVEKGYYLFRAPVGDAPIPLDTVSANRTTYGDYTGVPGIQYEYTLKAFDKYDSSHSDADLGKRTLKPPTGFVASDGTSESVIQLDWEDNSEAELGYKILRIPLGTTDTVEVGPAGKNEPAFPDTISGIPNGTHYRYLVMAFDNYGFSLAAADTGYTMIEAPANVNASEVYDDRTVLIWVDRSQIEQKYRLTRRQVGQLTTDPPIFLDAGTTMYTDMTGTPGVEYQYCVSAVLQQTPLVASDETCDVGLRLSPVVPPGGTPLVANKISSPYGQGFLSGGDRFGESVALDGDNALVGAPGIPKGQDILGFPTDDKMGLVYRYQFVLDEWTEQETWGGGGGLFNPADDGQDYGHSVALSGSYGAVGDPFFDDGSIGAFEVWLNSGDNTFPNWDEFYSVETNFSSDSTGTSIGLENRYVIVGNTGAEVASKSGHGDAIVCDSEQMSGLVATPCDDKAFLANALSAPDQKADAEFGASVGITQVFDTLYALVGAPGIDRAFLFKCDLSLSDCTSTSDWDDDIRKINTRFSPNRRFGAAVAINSKLAVVGSPEADGIVIYERTDGEWIEKDIFSPEDPAYGFGASIALNDTTILVGAPNEEVGDREDAGAVYVMQWDPAADELSEPIRYDMRVAAGPFGGEGTVREGAFFGTSVGVSGTYYLVGAPRDQSLFGGDRDGAVYFIPVGFPPPDVDILPTGVELAIPGEIDASDGTAPDRIQIRWEDESEDEEGHLVYRSKIGGELEVLKEVAENIEFFDDFDAAPGEAYTYCVAAFYGDTTTDLACDIGWRPPNGTIAGRVAAAQGGGTEDALVCISPNPAKSILFDGFGGSAVADISEELDVFNDFTIEAWIRPHAVDGYRYVASKDSAWALVVKDGGLQFRLFNNTGSLAGDDTVGTALGPVTAGEWHHVAITMDDQLDFTFYLDGVASTKINGSSNSNVLGDTLAIGQRGDGTGFFKGEIDEVKIWSPAQPDSLIIANRFMALEGDEENLLGYWPLDQGKRLVAPDLTEYANHAVLVDGAYLADEGAPLDACVLTESEGNYSISGIRYGESTEFEVSPYYEGREFDPSFKKITLTTESPAQNEVGFTDVTAYSIAGVVQYRDIVGSDTLVCAVPKVGMHADKSNLANDDNVRTTTGADGSYVLALDPSTDPQDFWYVIPDLVDPEDDEIVHTFDPPYAQLFVDDPVFDLTFNDELRHTLTGHVSGGAPDESCGKDIGEIVIRTYTQDGCYSRLDTVDSAIDYGAFSFDLPPLNYLMEVVEIIDPPSDRAAEVEEFFENLGAVELDMTGGDTERNLTYRAPIRLRIEGLDDPVCNQISQQDEDGNVLRTLPVVPTIGEYEFVPLEFYVEEDYGNDQVCPVDQGEVAIFDAIADRVDVDTTVSIENGVAKYTTFGASPNIFSGARIQGVDRSFQKPITVVAMVEGREFLTETRWALVEGFRERSATFVSATTEEFPLMILHDPPGSESYSFIEEGSTHCSRISSTKLVGGAAGALIDIAIGFKNKTGFSFGFHSEFGPFGGGIFFTTRTVAGRSDGTLWDEDNDGRADDNFEVCMSTTKTLSTYGDPTWVGEDIHVGVALNLIFAIADVLEQDQCSVSLTETLAADLDESEPFETTYAYGTSHIALSLIPELENLIKLAGGDATVQGQIKNVDTKIRLEQALDNWKKQLKNNEDLQEQALADPDINRSFSGGTEFTYAEAYDSTAVTRLETSQIYVDSDNQAGVLFSVGYDIKLGVAFEIHSEWNHEESETEGESKTQGYVLKDGDTGDYFSVDVAKDPRYGTFVFGTRSGRSSNPHEANTQKRDNPIINVDPPVLYNVDPEDAGSFDLTLINGSESNERRRYTMAIPGETNRQNLGVTVTGDLLGGNRLESFLLDPGKAITINMDVFPAPSAYAYNRVGVVLYPEDEFNIWLADPRQPFALADTAFFSVYFDSTGGAAMAAPMAEGWNWFSTNRSGGELNQALQTLNVTNGDMIRSQTAESRYDSTTGWSGTLTQLVPGQGYRIRLAESAIFRVEGEALETETPLELSPGWNWIGYMPRKRLPVDYALASLGDRVKPGDIIVGQDKFAQYVSGHGWIGTLKQMVPGESYAIDLTLGGKLSYPTKFDDVPRIPSRPHQLTMQGPDWDIEPERFDGAMTMVAEIRHSGIELEQEATRVAVFAGDSLRGVADVEFIESLDKHLAFVMIYGLTDEEDQEDLRVHVYDGVNDVLYESVGSLSYETQTMLGYPDDPIVLELTDAGSAPLLMELPEEFKLYGNYPNPFNPTTTIAYDLPDAVHVNLTVYDVLGRRVTTLLDREHRAGRHKVQFDAQTLASGFYVYRLKAGDYTEVRKMILTK